MPTDHVMSPEDVAHAELARLREDHRLLDARIAAMAAEGLPACNFTLGRLKREKLRLKDRIARLEDRLTPDIIA